MLYLLVFIQNLLVHLAEKILLIQPLTFGGDYRGTAGGPPKTGQFFMAIDPGVTSGGRFAPQLARLAKALDAEEGARLPGSRRLAARARAKAEGVAVSRSLLAEIAALQAAG